MIVIFEQDVSTLYLGVKTVEELTFPNLILKSHIFITLKSNKFNINFGFESKLYDVK